MCIVMPFNHAVVLNAVLDKWTSALAMLLAAVLLCLSFKTHKVEQVAATMRQPTHSAFLLWKHPLHVFKPTATHSSVNFLTSSWVVASV